MNKNVITSEKIPIKLWLDDIEKGALDQAKNLANLPFAYKHIAIMPDSHQGYGMPIGGVMATDSNIIVPNAVGVDIGCGMSAIKSDIIADSDICYFYNKDWLKEIMGKIRDQIPVGFKHNDKQQDDLVFEIAPDDVPIIKQELTSARKQLGTLGGGNHFIEIQKDEEGYIWIMLHSGSRNLGKKVADFYHNEAKEICKQYYSNIPNSDLSFLIADHCLGQEYLEAMNFCLAFAKSSRELMLRKVSNIIGKERFSGSMLYNIHHNYATMENHFGHNVMVHRKGATLARKGTIGIIPGSMGTNSYIVEGLGNPESFDSCSHGAGRKMGRKQSIRELDLTVEQAKMEGIIGGPRTANELDEAPGAYKDIETVMENQKDLVKILHTLSPLASVKG